MVYVAHLLLVLLRELEQRFASGAGSGRGLVSIVFGIIVFDEHLPGSETLEAVVALTVLLSVAAHGITANPLVELLRKPAEDTVGSGRQPVMKHGSMNGG